MARFIGIRHRVKKTAQGEARPTMVAIRDGGDVRTLELADDTAELDFMLGSLPTGWRDVEDGEDLSGFLRRHVVEKKETGKKEKEAPKKFRVPSGYQGMQAGDVVAMILGGSGDRLAYSMSRRGEEVGSTVLRIPPTDLKDRRDMRVKDEDHLILAELAESAPAIFYPVTLRDRDTIAVGLAYASRRDAQLDRMACAQRVRQRAIGAVHISLDGKYPEGTIEELYKEAEANDVILAANLKEEAKREAELKKAVKKTEVWAEIFAEVEGIGEVLAASLISRIADIRRFPTSAKLKKYCGVHVMKDGTFPRHKRQAATARQKLVVAADEALATAVENGGVVEAEKSNDWVPTLRQSLYLLGEQFNYRPDSVWGLKLLEYKKKFRVTHPEVETFDNKRGEPKKHYTNGHIHKMAMWRTRTKFVEWLFKEWWKVEERLHPKETQK